MRTEYPAPSNITNTCKGKNKIMTNDLVMYVVSLIKHKPWKWHHIFTIREINLRTCRNLESSQVWKQCHIASFTLSTIQTWANITSSEYLLPANTSNHCRHAGENSVLAIITTPSHTAKSHNSQQDHLFKTPNSWRDRKQNYIKYSWLNTSKSINKAQ